MKIGIIGMGWVGSSVAISLLQRGVARELLLHDVREGLAEGEAMDLAHGDSFYPTARVRAAEVAEMKDADAVVIAAGRGTTAEQSRLEVAQVNAEIVRQIGAQLRGARGMLVMLTNPVDVLTQVLTEVTGLPPARVIGTGTLLETSRLRSMLGAALGLDPRSVHAQVVGEHGDSNVVLWSSAHVAGIPLRGFPGWDPARQPEVAEKVRTAAYEIIRRKGATNHAIGLCTAQLLRWALRREHRVVTISRVQEGVAGVDGVALSLPTVIGADGAHPVLAPTLDEVEREGLHRSAELLRRAYDDVARV